MTPTSPLEKWMLLLIADKFRFDEKEWDEFVLKEKLSPEAWDRVKDLFYYDKHYEDWVTNNPVEVIERLRDSEWELDVKIFSELNDWRILLLMYEFERVYDEKGNSAYLLKEEVKKTARRGMKYCKTRRPTKKSPREISEKAWYRVKDLFYFDRRNWNWVTQNPIEVIERLKNNEWKLRARIFQEMFDSLKLDNAREYLEFIELFTPELAYLQLKCVKTINGEQPKIAEGVKVIKKVNQYSKKCQKLIVEKDGEKYVAFIIWNGLRQERFIGAVWKRNDVKGFNYHQLTAATVAVNILPALASATFASLGALSYVSEQLEERDLSDDNPYH